MKKKNELAIICGGSYGLGFEISKFFVQKKISTIILSRDRVKLQLAIKKISSRIVSGYSCNLDNPTDVAQVLKKIKNKNLEINYLVCNAGSGKIEYPENENIKNFYNSYNKNFFTAINPIEILFNLKNFKNLNIIVISSIAAYFKGNAPLSYSLAKNSLVNYCRETSKKFAKKKIRINSISPGHIYQNNNLWFYKLKKNKKKINEFIKKNVSMQRFCKPEDVINCINFLISNESNYLTGIDIKVDGNTN